MMDFMDRAVSERLPAMNFAFKMMNFGLTIDEFIIKNDDFCIQNDEFERVEAPQLAPCSTILTWRRISFPRSERGAGPH